MIKEYLRMKRNEWKVKAYFYELVAEMWDNQKDIIGFIRNLYIALKDTPVEDLKNEVISQAALLVHEESQKERNSAE